MCVTSQGYDESWKRFQVGGPAEAEAQGRSWKEQVASGGRRREGEPRACRARVERALGPVGVRGSHRRSRFKSVVETEQKDGVSRTCKLGCSGGNSSGCWIIKERN